MQSTINPQIDFLQLFSLRVPHVKEITSLLFNANARSLQNCRNSICGLIVLCICDLFVLYMWSICGLYMWPACDVHVLSVCSAYAPVSARRGDGSPHRAGGKVFLVAQLLACRTHGYSNGPGSPHWCAMSFSNSGMTAEYF